MRDRTKVCISCGDLFEDQTWNVTKEKCNTCLGKKRAYKCEKQYTCNPNYVSKFGAFRKYKYKVKDEFKLGMTVEVTRSHNNGSQSYREVFKGVIRQITDHLIFIATKTNRIESISLVDMYTNHTKLMMLGGFKK